MDARHPMLAELNKHRAGAFAEAEAAREQQGQVRPTLDEVLGSLYERAGSAVASFDELTQMTAQSDSGTGSPVPRSPTPARTAARI